MIQPRLRFNEFHDTWTYKLLNKIAKITMGQSPLSKNYTHNPNYYLLVQGNADLLNGHIHPRLFTKQITKISHKGNIILTVRAPVGDTAINNYGNLVIGRGVANIRGNRFLYELFNRIQLLKHWNRYSTGSTFDSINSKILKNLNIIIPSLSEQRAIGKFFAKLDKLIQLQQKKVSLLKKLKRGYLQKLFPRKGESVPRLRFKGFHDKWIQVTINDISNYKNGHSLEKLAVSTHSNSAKIIIDLNSISIDGTLKDSGKRLPNDFKNTLNKNDLVMILSDLAHGNLIGLTAIIPKNNTYALNQRVGLLRFNKNINSIFMHYLLNSIQRYFHRMSAGTSQLNLSKKDILQTKLLIPSLDEQTKISNFLNHLDSNISIHRDKLNCFRKLKKAYLQKMFC